MTTNSAYRQALEHAFRHALDHFTRAEDEPVGATVSLDELRARLGRPLADHGHPAEIIVVNHDTALAIKVSFPRPQSSGSRHDSDVYGGQQYAPLLGLEVGYRGARSWRG